MSDKPFRIPPELEDVVNQIGEFIEYWGFKNVHGRIWTHLFLSPEPLDAGELVGRLGVSKALVSMSIADLTEYDVIQVAGKSSRATVCYKTNPDIVGVISNILRKRERRMLCRLSSAAKLLKDLPANSRSAFPLSDEKARLLTEMVGTAEATLDQMLQLSDVPMECWNGFKDC